MKNEKENKGLAKGQQQTELDKTNKGSKSDTSNSLERDAVGKMGSNNPTPQARTDNEQDDQKNK
ncbi:hypothetical protein [Pontibacter roseus]|uniref:hypothetical protein n=1 Tax=Pontibacter roseus TaxID=336989 RepID=UPI000364B939|nr:hypothetical protein [Pontibacter roseus]